VLARLLALLVLVVEDEEHHEQAERADHAQVRLAHLVMGRVRVRVRVS